MDGSGDRWLLREPAGRTPLNAQRIVLVRHGRSAHVQRGLIDAEGFRKWRVAYEGASIRPDDRPPDKVLQMARNADLFVSSDARRAVASAELLTNTRPITVSPLLRELDLETLPLGPLRLPLLAWAVAVGVRTLSLTLRGRYPSSHEAERLREAADWLGQLANDHSLIVAVTHASFRKLFAQKLADRGWRHEPGDRSTAHWSAWEFTRVSRVP